MQEVVLNGFQEKLIMLKNGLIAPNKSQLIVLLLCAFSVVLLVTMGTLLGLLLFLLKICLFGLLPGYFLLSKFVDCNRRELLAVSVLIGLAVSVNLYALARYADLLWFFYFLVFVLAIIGGQKLFSAKDKITSSDMESYALLAGFAVMLLEGVAFFRSGTIDNNGIAFFGPMARDHIFHLAQIGRFEFHVPSDNFVISGYASPAYHFFSDLLLYMLATEPKLEINLLDTYFKYYPSIIFFGIGYFCFHFIANLFNDKRIAALGIVVIVLGADMSWVAVLPKLAMNMFKPGDVLGVLFSPWIDWHPFGVLYPLVHRPAHYHGLLFFMAGLTLLTSSTNLNKDRDNHNRRSWIGAAFLFGLMAGFNFTLSGVIGMAIVLIIIQNILTTTPSLSKTLIYSSLAYAVALAPILFFIKTSHIVAAGSSALVFNAGAFPLIKYGDKIRQFVSNEQLVTILSVLMFLLISYNIKLIGLFFVNKFPRKAGQSEIWSFLFYCYFISLIIGVFFEFGGVGGISSNIIFLQPTIYLMGILTIYPIFRIIQTIYTRQKYIAILVFFMLLVGPIQAVLAYNLSYKVEIKPELLSVLSNIRKQSTPDSIIAFSPTTIQAVSIYGDQPLVNNFYISALTGRRSFFSVDGYSMDYLQNTHDRLDYETRKQIISSVALGDVTVKICSNLAQNKVSYVFLELPEPVHGACIDLLGGDGRFYVYRITSNK